MRITFLFSIMIFLLAGCNKDKFTSAPQLKYKSVNTNILSQNQDLVFTFSFTDAEGDLSDSILVNKVEPSCVGSNFTQPYPLPVFPSKKNQTGDLRVVLNYNDVPPKCFPRNDTCVFKFVLKDKAQHLSDTAVSETIVILQ